MSRLSRNSWLSRNRLARILSWWLWLRRFIGFRRLGDLLDLLNWLLHLILIWIGFRLLLGGRFFRRNRSRDCARSGKPTASYNAVARPPERHIERIRRRLCIGIIGIRGLR